MKVLLWVVLVCLAGGWAGGTASAVGEPYIIVGENIWLTDRETDKKIFLLPETYYAAIEGMDENYYYVVFNGISGKVEKKSVKTTGYGADAIGTSRVMNISSKYKLFDGIRLCLSPDSEESEVSVPTSDSFLYLGSYPFGDAVWYCVRYGDAVGYLPAEFTDQSSLQIEPFVPEEETETATMTEETDGTEETVKLFVVIGLGVLVIAVMLITFLPYKKKKTPYRENE